MLHINMHIMVLFGIQPLVLGQYAVIREAVSTKIHYKWEKNRSEKPKVAKQSRVFHEEFPQVYSE